MYMHAHSSLYIYIVINPLFFQSVQGYSHVAFLPKKTRQQLLEFEQFLQRYNIIHISYNADNSHIRFLLDNGYVITMVLNSLNSELQSMHIDKSIHSTFKNVLAVGVFFEQTCIVNQGQDIGIYLYNFGNKNNKKTIPCPLPFSIEQLMQMTPKEMKLSNSNNLLCIKYDNNTLVIVSLTYVTFIKFVQHSFV
jgi:hypothetical protein